MAGAIAILLCAGFMLQHHPDSRQWLATLQSNLASTLGPGGSADPRPDNYQAVGDINLQAITSIFIPSAREFNFAAYGVFVALLAVLVAVVLRSKQGPETQLLALAALTLLSLTPIYHRHYDTRLLILTIPAVVIVFAQRRFLALVIAGFTVLAIVSFQYRVQLFLIAHGKWSGVLQNKFFFPHAATPAKPRIADFVRVVFWLPFAHFALLVSCRLSRGRAPRPPVGG